MAGRTPHELMQQSLSLAVSNTRRVLPNPTVGALLVAADTIIGQGCHERFGGPHAEVNAIASVKDRALLPLSTLYVTLEPCSHTGKTPPCVDLIIASRIPRVVVGCRDPYPQVSGRGIHALRDAGIEVVEGVLHDECILANSRFILAHRMQRPYIILKWAQTANGFIAPPGGEPTAISSAQSRQLLHYWRGQEMAIAVGNNTARLDNPQLTVRHVELYRDDELPPLHPARVVIGDVTHLPAHLALWNSATPTIAFAPITSPEKPTLRHVSVCDYDAARPLLPQLCRTLYERQILSVLVEGGAATLQSFIEADLWDEIRVFSSPTSWPSGQRAPTLPHAACVVTTTSGPDTLELVAHPHLAARVGVRDSSLTPLLLSATQPLAGVPRQLRQQE